MKVITNRVPRLIIDDYELTAKEREEFDYIDWEAIDDGRASASFVRYKGQLYDYQEFQMTGAYFGSYWHGYRSDTFFSGVLMRNCEDPDYVIVGRYST